MDVTAALASALAGRYTIERELGRGGMATVYLARDIKHDRLVALKVLDPELGAVLGVERFLSEIRVTANLQHPHLLPLFDSGSAEGLLYYVMPYVQGESLRARLDREKQLPIDESLRLTLAVLSALAYAHEHGIVHRDLKPENILLQAGEPVVADFGIALAVSNAGGQRVTQTGLSLGTPQYMSPEQATGDRVIDARSDIYSMGAVLYEMLSGEPPHTGASVQAIIAKLLTERPRSIRAGRDTVPESVDAATMRALAKLPADRWSTAHEFAEALRGSAAIAIREGHGALAHLSRRMQHAARSITTWRVAAAALLVAAALLAWLAFRPPPASMQLQLARQLTFEGDVVAAAISPDGAWLAYVADDCFGQTFSCTRTLQVREVDGTQSVKLLTWPSIGSDVRWSPDGETVGFTGTPDSASRLSLFVIPRLGGTAQRVGAAPVGWTFTSDGKVLEVTGRPEAQSLVWLDPHTFARTDSAPLPKGFAFAALDQNPDDGSLVATARVRGAPGIVLLDGRGTLLDTTTAFDVRRPIRWDASHHGVLDFVAAPGTADNLRLTPVAHGKLSPTASRIVLGQVSDGVQGLLDVSRSGRVVVAAGPAAMDLVTARLGQPATTWTTLVRHTSWVFANRFSPDGATLAGSATDNVGENIYLFPMNGSAPRQITARREIIDYPVWSPDGRHLAYDALTTNSAFVGTMFTDADGGSERRIPHAADDGHVIGWFGNDAVVLTLGYALEIIDTTGVVRRRIAIPASLAITSTHAYNDGVYADAALRRSAYWSTIASAVISVDLTSGRFSRVFSSETPLQPVGWGRDGSLFVTGATSTAGDSARASGEKRDLVLEKIAPDGKSIARVATLPVGCWTDSNGATVNGDGTVAACTTIRYTPDVWLADRGQSGW